MLGIGISLAKRSFFVFLPRAAFSFQSKHRTAAVHYLPTMTGSIDVQTPAQTEEKGIMQHQENIHRRDADGSSNEAGLHESEKDIPVRPSTSFFKASNYTHCDI